MLGAIAGDVIGSAHEATATKTKRFDLFTAESEFTDDTVLTCAVAEAILTGEPYAKLFHRYYAWYPDAGYGAQFRQWAACRRTKPYGSWGNGSAMRVSPIAWACDTLGDVLHEAEESAAVTHDHPEGVRGAQATAAAVFLARTGTSLGEIRGYVERTFGYDLSRSVRAMRPAFLFDTSCAGTVPPALRSFLEANDFEDAVRNAVSLGGDADTLACVAGAVAEGRYGVPPAIEVETLARLDTRLGDVLARFRESYPRA